MRFSSLVVYILIPFVGAVPSWRMNYNINVSQIDLYYKRERENLSKVVLIMNMPEQVCQKCKLCYETENGDEYMCCATGKLVPDGKRPDWCPLRELPERKPASERRECEGSARGTWQVPLLENMGWNACLDEITGNM